MNERLFRDAMGKFATGITVVSMNDAGKNIGMTVNAFMSISLDPMLIAVSIDDNASMFEQLNQTNKFGVSMLSADQEELSMYFARQTELDYEVAFIEQDGVPVLQNALASISCNVKEKVRAGDHLIFIAEVTDISINEGEPILYFGGKYRHLKEIVE